MKTLVTVIFVLFFLSGCVSSNYAVGNDFNSLNVEQIEKGKTTSEELVTLIGQPYTKAVLSQSDEKWVYMYSTGTTKATSYIVSMDVKTTGTQKILDVLITDGIVVNFTFTEGQNPYTMSVN